MERPHSLLTLGKSIITFLTNDVWHGHSFLLNLNPTFPKMFSTNFAGANPLPGSKFQKFWFFKIGNIIIRRSDTSAYLDLSVFNVIYRAIKQFIMVTFWRI